MEFDKPRPHNLNPSASDIKARRAWGREIERIQRRLQDHPWIEGVQLHNDGHNAAAHLSLWTQSRPECTGAWVNELMTGLATGTTIDITMAGKTRDGVITPRQFDVCVGRPGVEAQDEAGEQPETQRAWRFLDQPGSVPARKRASA